MHDINGLHRLAYVDEISPSNGKYAIRFSTEGSAI